MTHLRESEFVDLLDNQLPGPRARHVDQCAACAGKLDAIQRSLGRVADVEVPEPSPLFWEHFSARVRDGVRDVTPAHESPWSAWLHHGGVRWAIAGMLVAVIAVAGTWRSVQQTTTHSANQADPNPIVTPRATPDDDDARESLDVSASGDDRAWDLVQALADDVHWDDQLAAGLEARPGTVERAVLSLKGEARAEIVRLLEAETKQPGA